VPHQIYVFCASEETIRKIEPVRKIIFLIYSLEE